LIVNIRFDAGKTPLSAIHSTVRGNVLEIEGINQILLFSGGSNKYTNHFYHIKDKNLNKTFKWICYLTLDEHHDTCSMKKFHIERCPIVLGLSVCLSVFAQYDQYK
jgi:hypothetical protein